MSEISLSGVQDGNSPDFVEVKWDAGRTGRIILKVDSVWHDCDKELPGTSTEVEFMDRNGEIRAGRIVVDSSGFFACTHDDNKWVSLEKLVKWRFCERG